MIAHMSYIHLTLFHAHAAARASVRVHPDARKGKAVEQAIDRTQRAEKPAEGAVAEYAGQADDQHDDPFAGKDQAQLIERSAVGRMLQDAHRAFQGACGADILAESRKDHALGDAHPERYSDDSHSKDHIFEPGQRAGIAAPADLRRGDSVEQLLNQTQRADPAADGAPEHHPEQGQDAQHIPGRCMPGGIQRILKRTQRTAGDGARTGIAVQARHTGRLQIPGIDVSVHKAPEIRVIQKGRVQLHQTPGPQAHSFFFLIQFQHTPYRWRNPWQARHPFRH